MNPAEISGKAWKLATSITASYEDFKQGGQGAQEFSVARPV